MQEQIRVMRLLAIACLSAVLIGCGGGDPVNRSKGVRFIFGDAQLLIPQAYLLSGLPSTMVPEEGLDANGGISLNIPLFDLGIQSTPQPGLANSVTVFVVGHSVSDTDAPMKPSALDAWNATGLFKERIIEFDDEVNLYRVYPKSGYPSFWEYFKTSPDDGGSVRSSWVSGCWASGSGSLVDATCDITDRYKTIESTITISGKNLVQAGAIRAGYRELIGCWDVAACQNSSRAID